MAQINLRLLFTKDHAWVRERAIQSSGYFAREIVELTESESRLVEVIRQEDKSYEEMAAKRIAGAVHST